jgi:hypothetical protein
MEHHKDLPIGDAENLSSDEGAVLFLDLVGHRGLKSKQDKS